MVSRLRCSIALDSYSVGLFACSLLESDRLDEFDSLETLRGSILGCRSTVVNDIDRRIVLCLIWCIGGFEAFLDRMRWNVVL